MIRNRLSKKRARGILQELFQETMYSTKEGNKKTKIALQPNTISLSCEEKRKLADEEEEALQMQIEALKTWTDNIDTMNEEELKEYLKNRPAELKTVKIQNSRTRQKVQRVGKSKSSISHGIMASVWKFHKPDNKV